MVQIAWYCHSSTCLLIILRSSLRIWSRSGWPMNCHSPSDPIFPPFGCAKFPLSQWLTRSKRRGGSFPCCSSLRSSTTGPAHGSCNVALKCCGLLCWTEDRAAAVHLVTPTLAAKLWAGRPRCYAGYIVLLSEVLVESAFGQGKIFERQWNENGTFDHLDLTARKQPRVDF